MNLNKIVCWCVCLSVWNVEDILLLFTANEYSINVSYSHMNMSLTFVFYVLANSELQKKLNNFLRKDKNCLTN